MKVLEFRKNITSQDPVIVTIGNFDGVHLGHQSLIRKIVKEAQQRSCSSVLMTFDPHPQEVIHPQLAVPKICTPDLRIKLLEVLGLDAVHIIRFTKDFSKLSPEDFALHFLIERFNIVKLVVGYDFHFGKSRAGNATLLENYAQKYRFDFEQIHPIQIDGRTVSSTLIREMISNNQFDEIPKLLGRHYSIYAVIEKGDQRGHTLGFPTANQCLGNIPLNKGVYVTKVTLREQTYYGVTNVGVKPTFGQNEQAVETHIFDFDEDIYGEFLEVKPLKFLRGEKKFSNIASLTQQIKDDIQTAKSYLQSENLI